MTPVARQELHAYCERARRERIAKHGWTPPASFADKTDLAIACICAAGILVLSGYSWADYIHQNKRKECPAVLDDGRALTAFHIGADGPERCVYVAPIGRKK